MEGRSKRLAILFVKLLTTAAVVALIFHNLLGRDGASAMLARLRAIDLRFFAAAIAVQLVQVAAGTVRFDRLLVGQGIHATLRHLVGTMLVGRFVGAVTPGAIGVQGYKIYDLAVRTGKSGRATAAVAIEMVSGWLGFALVLGSVTTAFGKPYVGEAGIVAIDSLAGLVVLFSALLLARPRLFKALTRRVLGETPTRVEPLVDAVCAYEGKGLLLLQVVALSTTIHLGHDLVYLLSARALGLHLRVGEIFFVSSVQLLATLVPITINGVGVREATGGRLYAMVGVPASLGVLVPFVGFIVETLVSLCGALVLLVRGPSYRPAIEVEDEGREDLLHATIEHLDVELPELTRGLVIGLAAGLVAGLLIGVGEGIVVLASGSGTPDFGVLAYGIVLYGAAIAPISTLVGLLLVAFARAIRRPRGDEARTFAAAVSVLVATVGFVIGAYRMRRDVFHEALVWRSKQGVLVLACTALIAAATAIVVSALARAAVERRPFRALLHPLGTPAFVALVVAALFGYQHLRATRPSAGPRRTLVAAPDGAGSVLVIAIDGLRADRLPAYGYARGRTPSLDRFAADAIRFDAHFANAATTRASLASILTGRHPTSHSVLAETDALPEAVVTMAEAFGQAGYTTAGVTTGPDLAPFFDFQQGFDTYDYLEPGKVLGANDAQSKLLLAEALRRIAERLRPVPPGRTYQDAAAVTDHVLRTLARGHRDAPFFLFATYADPGEPYFAHPYRGPGYARALHPHPRANEAARIGQLYDGEITFTDRHLGRLFDALRARGLYDGLTIVVTSTHGQELGERGGFWNGDTLFDEQVHVPLFVKLPGNERGGEVVEEWSESIDLLPSLLAANGVPSAEGVHGRTDLLARDFVGATEIFAEETRAEAVLRSLRIRRASSVLTLLLTSEAPERDHAGLALYRVDQDPEQRVDLAREDHALTSRLALHLLKSEAAAREGEVEGRRIGAASVDTCGTLHALGYVARCETEPARDADAH